MTSALPAVASILIPVVVLLGAVVCVFVGAALLLGLSELIADEARGWLELTPRGILRLVAMRLPVGQREAIYSEEWLPELLFKMRKGEERPISRLVIGAWYAISMARGAGKVGRELDGVREPEDAFRIDVSVSVEADPDIYVDLYTGRRHPDSMARVTAIEMEGGAGLSATATMGGGGARIPDDPAPN